MGKELKKGTRGTAANYMSRNKCLKKLQITLKDFRRLCIVKGIFPRDPKKKKDGKDKTYYHVKDIKFLAHEPLLMKFRELKTFLKKHKKALVKKDKSKLERLNKHKPQMTMDHLVRERYPTFIDAIRDLDDPLCMVHLFASLPSKITRNHSPEMADLSLRLCKEFESFVFTNKCLKKTFVSIKGIYYQAEIMGQSVTWLVPHKFCPIIPSDVDFRVMVTFLEFYLTMVKFVNFKLYHDNGLKYPPQIDELAKAQRAGLGMINLEKLGSESTTTTAKTAKTTAATKNVAEESLQAAVDSVIENLEEVQAEAETEGMGDGEDEEDDELLSMQTVTETPVFAGLTVLLSREVPYDSLEFVLLCGGAVVIREDQVDDAGVRSEIITHQIVDRPKQTHVILSRDYVQPQWIYDSINSSAMLPCLPYKPGRPLPPHLSPFVDDEEEGYVPQQRKVLEDWGAKTNGSLSKTGEKEDEVVEEDEGDGNNDGEDNDEDDEDDDDDDDLDGGDKDTDEARYANELEKEASGQGFSALAEDEEEEGEGDEEEGEGDEGEGDAEEEDDDDEVQEPASKKARQAAKEKELAMIMMKKKDKRLYGRMQHGIAKKQAVVAGLEAKRKKIEKSEKPLKKRKR